MDLEFLKTLYFRELERRAQLDSAPTFRVAVLALIGTVMSYYLQRFTLANTLGSWLFILCAGGVIFFSTLSIVWIVRIYVGFDWEYLPTAKELRNYERALFEYHAQYGIDGQTPSALFNSHLEKLLVSAATRNTSNNNTRSEWLYRASLFLSCAVVGTLLAGAPVLFQAFAFVVQK
jgi:hypothetical protein